ncbi:hypothetical protein RKD29_007954 [Streptomyces tendae]
MRGGRSPARPSATTCHGPPRSGGPTGTPHRGRPLWPTGPHGLTGARPGPVSRRSARSCTCAGNSVWDRSRSPDGWAARLDGPRGPDPLPINRLSHIDRATGEPVRRYEHPRPGAMLHIDVKKLGNVPDGGSRRCVGRFQGRRSRAATPDKPRNKYRGPLLGTAFVHTVVDDHSRVACAEVRDNETADTAVDVLHHAVAWSAARGVSVERVLTDNGSACRSRHWSRACTELAHHAEEDQALPAADERQGRTLPPHPGRRLGPGTLLLQRISPPQSPAGLAPSLQSPPLPHRNRRQTTRHQVDQRHWAVQVCGSPRTTTYDKNCCQKGGM